MVELVLLAAFLFQTVDPYQDGVKALEANDYATAVAAFRKAVEADPKDYAAHFHLGLSHYLTKNNAAAAASYRTALELKPGLFEAELNLGIVLLALEDHPAAEKHFRSAAEIKAGQASVHSGLGRAIMLQGRLRDAEPELRKAAELDARYRDGLLELASHYEKNKQNKEAIAIYLEFPDDLAVRERLGQLYLELDEPASAVPHLEHAVKGSPSPANLYALATAYLRLKETEKAAALMQQAIAAEPKNADLALSYAGMLRDQRNFQAAAQQYWRAAQIDPASKQAWTGLATMLMSLENYPQALAAFDKLEALGETEPGLHFLRAVAYDRGKNYKPALASYQKFLSLSQNRFPDEEFKARQRIKVIEKELSRR